MWTRRTTGLTLGEDGASHVLTPEQVIQREAEKQNWCQSESVVDQIAAIIRFCA